MKKILIALFILVNFSVLQAQYLATKDNLIAREWFENAKFGLFVHWGVYSVLGDGEWVMQNQNIPIHIYEKIPAFFNPSDFDPNEWVVIMKEAGMKYITFTTRHHDGFSMFDSKVSDYNVVRKTPYGKDVFKQLVDACHKEGIKVFAYYSLLDWHNDDYFPRGRTGKGIKGRKEGDWNKYIDFMKTQLTELLTNYGEIAGIWFDGHWDQKEWDGKKFGKLKVDWHYDEIYKLIHDLQPQCLIGNNHHIAPIEGEDFQMFERDLPGHNTTGWGTKTENVGQLPKEVCETINNSWGFNLKDDKHKSPKTIIHYLVKAAGYGSNLLLNVGPMPNGKIQTEHIETLKKIGQWLKENGETIYGSKGGYLSPTEDMAITRKGNIMYVHVLNPDVDIVFLKEFKPEIESITYYSTNQSLESDRTKYGLFIKLPQENRNDIDSIIEIKIK